MAGLPHSVRFMSGRGGTRTETFTVPEGKRAVIRHIAFTPFGAGGAGGFVKAHGIIVFWRAFTGANPTLSADVRFTCYAGETIAVVTEGTDTAYAVDGFLLDDLAGLPDDRDNVIVP